MERGRSKQASVLIWALAATLLSQNLVVSVMSAATVGDQKTYYPSPDPHAGSPPTGHGSPPSYGGTPPSHHGTPSHGGGSSHGTPPANCGNPPSGHHHDPSPSTPTGGSPPTGGSYSPPTYTPTPSIPTPSIPTPSTPYTPTPSIPTPSTPTIISPPTTPIDPGTPTTPIYPGTPTTPIDPGTPTIPGISIPSPPLLPSYPPIGGTCDYWRTHPGYIWGLFGWWGTTVGGALGVSSIPGFGSHLSLQQALSNTRSDGFGALYREGTASLLNSMVNNRFPFTTNQVRDNFVSALGSNKAAAAQARVFKKANEGRLKPRA